MSNQTNGFSVYPTIGQVVSVGHRSDNGKLVKSGRELRTIKQVHIIAGGYPTIQDSAGDVWHVKPAKLGEWETVISE